MFGLSAGSFRNNLRKRFIRPPNKLANKPRFFGMATWGWVDIGKPPWVALNAASSILPAQLTTGREIEKPLVARESLLRPTLIEA
jgi:hypothetical protein